MASETIADMVNENYGEILLPSSLSISSRLYVGSLTAAEDADFIESKGITHVLTAAGRLRVDLPEPRPIHLSIDLADHPTANIFDFLDQALEFCDAALGLGGNVADRQGALLVHCASGVSRSVAICMALLMTRASLTYDEALALVRTNRPQGSPNLGFQRQLQLLEENNGDISKAKKTWLEMHGQDIMEEARVQRDSANNVHAELDGVENEIASSYSANVADAQKTEFLRRLDSIQDKIDTCQGEAEDRVAKTILKAAGQKVARLIDQINK